MIQNDAETEDIAAPIDGFRGAKVLRTHVRRGACQFAGAGDGHALVGDVAGQAEIADLDPAGGFVEQNVGRFDIAMDHATRVGRRQAEGDLARYVRGLVGA